MAKKRVTSRPGLFGYIYHYDEKGKCIGKSCPSLMGDGKVHYDGAGKQVGTSRPGFFAKEVYHDQEDDRYITSYEALTGDVYFEDGTPIGTSRPGFFGAEYTTLDVDNEATEEYYDEDEYLDDDSQELPEHNESEGKSALRNLIVFAACCLIVGILMLIFK